MPHPSSTPKLSVNLLRQIDGLCAKFEAALRAGRSPNPARLLDLLRHLAREPFESRGRETSLLSQFRQKLLRELLLLEFEYRGPAEREAVIADWIKRSPADNWQQLGRKRAGTGPFSARPIVRQQRRGRASRVASAEPG
jgi:hypothetical protein